MATNVRGYSIPVLNLNPGLDETKLAEVVTSVLLRAALSASTPWPKWILLAALELLHGRQPVPLDAATLSFLTQQPLVQTRAEGNIYDTAVTHRLEDDTNFIPVSRAVFQPVTSKDKLATIGSVKPISFENATALGELCNSAPLIQNKVNNQKQATLKNTSVMKGAESSNVLQRHKIRELIAVEEVNNTMGSVNEVHKYKDDDSTAKEIIMNTLTNNDLETNTHTGKCLHSTTLNYSTSATVSNECPATSVEPSVQCINIEDSLERMDICTDETIRSKTVNNNFNDSYCTESLEPVLQLESTDSNTLESLLTSPSAISRNKLTSDHHMPILDNSHNTTSISTFCPLPQPDNHTKQVPLETTETTLQSFDNRTTTAFITKHKQSNEQHSNQTYSNYSLTLPTTDAFSNTIIKPNILQELIHKPTTASIPNNLVPSVRSVNKACQTYSCKTANIHTQAEVTMVTKWVQVKKRKFRDQGIQSSVNTELQMCNNLYQSEHVSTQTNVAGVDGEVIKRSAVADKGIQTVSVASKSVGVKAHTKKKSSRSVWNLTPVFGVATTPRVTASSDSTPDKGDREQLFHGRPLNTKEEKIIPLIPLQALDGLGAHLSDPRLQ